MKNIDCVLIIIRLVFGRIQALKNLINYQFIAWLSAYKDVLSNILQLKPVIFKSFSKVSLNIVESVYISKIVILIIRLVFGRIQALKNLINYQFIAWLSAYKDDVLSNILQLKPVIFKIFSNVGLNIVENMKNIDCVLLIIRLVFGRIQALKNLINYQFIAWLSAYKDVLPNILQLKRVIFKSASKVSLNIVERGNISKIVILIIRLVFGRIQALKNLINYQFIAWLSAYKDVLSNILQLEPVIFEIFSNIGLNIVENMKIIDCVLLTIRLVFGRIQALKNRINYQFIAWLSAYKDVLSNILNLKPVFFNSASKVSLNIVESVNISKKEILIIRLVVGRIKDLKNLINCQFIAWLSAYKDVLSNILQLKPVIFKSFSKVSLNIVESVYISKIVILIIRLVFGRIQALKNLINYQFIAWLSAYKDDVLSNILQLKPVIFKIFSNVGLNIVENMKNIDCVLLIIRLVFGRIQALKNLINYQFIAWLSAYKDVLPNILQLKRVIFKSASKVSLNIVERGNISKIVILIIRLVFGRIQALKNLINYQFIAWLSAYKDVLSNILQLEPVIFEIFSNIGLNIVENMKIIDCVLLTIRLVFGRIQALKNRINYQFIAWLSAYKDVLSNILNLKPVFFNSASKVSLNIVESVNISKKEILIIRLVVGRIKDLKNLINCQFIVWLSAYKDDVLSNILQLKPVVFNSAYKVSLNTVENMKIIDCVLIIIRLVFGRIQALKNLINYQFIAWLSAYKDVLSNILQLKPVIFKIFSNVGLNIVENMKIIDCVLLIIRLVFGGIQALKNLINYQFIAWLSAYKDVLSNILQLKPVVFNSAYKVSLNTVENMKIIDCVLLIIRLVFGGIQALKNLINYQFIAWLSAYKDVLSNILQLKPVIFKSFSKVSLNIVESVYITKIVILIIRLVFGRIQPLKNLINYQFIAWLSAYKDVLSNILQLKPVIFIIFSKVRLNTVDNMKIID